MRTSLLTQKQLDDVTAMLERGRQSIEIANAFNVHPSNVRDFKRAHSLGQRLLSTKHEKAEIRSHKFESVPIDVLWDKAAEINKQKIKEAETLHNFDAKFTDNLPIAVSFASDQHISVGNTVDLEQMKADAQLIAATDGMSVVCVGDAIDNHCVDETTQALTKSGWKNWWAIAPGDEVFGIDPETRIGSWQSITRLIWSQYDGELVHIQSESVDVLCTPGHRVLCNKKDTRIEAERSPFFYEDAGRMESRRQIPVSATCDFSDTEGITDCELKFVAWILTDGWLTPRKTMRPQYRIAQRSSNAEVVRELFSESGYTYKEYIRSSESILSAKQSIAIATAEDMHTFACDSELNDRLGVLVPTKDRLPHWVYNLSDRQFAIFLEAVIEGDGSLNGKSYILYGKERFLEEMQIACVTHGHRAVLTSVANRTEKRLLISRATVQQINGCGSRERKNRVPYSRQEYSGVVWCLQVPLGNFFIRRNGKPCITGNCKHKSAMLHARSTPGDQYKLLDYYLGIIQQKLLVLISGNHDDWTNQFAGVDVLKMLADKNKVMHAPDEARISIALPSHTYQIAARHQYRFNSQLNQTHSLKQWFKMGSAAFDIGVLAHLHELAMEPVNLHGLERWVCRPGSYQITSAYSRQLGFNIVNPSCPTFILYPDRRDIVGFTGLRHAARFLTYERERYAEAKGVSASVPRSLRRAPKARRIQSKVAAKKRGRK